MLLGLIPEPPLDPRSWSGSAAPFFTALKTEGLLQAAEEVKLSPSADAVQKARVFRLPVGRWKEAYHASVPRFRALGRVAARHIEAHRPQSVLQIGAWFCAGAVKPDVPAFSYHDGNAAERYRHYGIRSAAHLAWERYCYEHTRGIFVMSAWLASSFMRDFAVPANKLHVVGAGINLQRLPVVPERSFEQPRFLFVGRDFERKGGRYLLEAFRKVRSRVANAELTIVGPDPRGAEPGVMWAGLLSKSNPAEQRKLEALFERATAVVLPSVYEPFGISLTEGMMYGLPAIAVDRCAMPEIVRDRENGLIARAQDADDLARAMIELACDPARSAEYGRAGRQRAERNYTWQAVAGKIRDVLTNDYSLAPGKRT